MKSYLKDIFPRIVRYSKRLDDITVLTEKPWVMISEESTVREVWIFQKNGELIVSRNGIAAKGSWDYIQQARSLYIDVYDIRRLFNQAFVDDVAFLLKLDGKDDIIPFVNEIKLKDNFRLISYLENQYHLVEPTPPPRNSVPPPRRVTKPKPAKKPRQYSLQDWVRDVNQKHAMIKLVSMLGLIAILVAIIIFIVSKANISDDTGRLLFYASLGIITLITISVVRKRRM